MADDLSGVREDLVASLTGGEFTVAVLWGALVASLVAIAEYNLTATTGNTIEVSYFMLVGGGVAGAIYVGPRESAAKAGALAGGIPVVVLAPLAYLFTAVDGILDGSVGSPLVNTAFVLLVLLPIVVGIGMLGGAIAAFATHWVFEQLIGSRADGSESDT